MSILAGNRVRDLQSAKHRFASSSKPAARVVLHLDAVLATVHEITTRRAPHQEEHKNLQKFLDWVDAERLMTLAVMADAADESLAIIRLFDSQYDPSNLAGALAEFIHKLDVLFLQRQILESPHTYSSYMLRSLRRRPRLLRASTGVKSLGGPGCLEAEAMDRIFSHMAGWVRLCVKSLDAEFPDWEVLQAIIGHEDVARGAS